jgi:hypothetical protein
MDSGCRVTRLVFPSVAHWQLSWSDLSTDHGYYLQAAWSSIESLDNGDSRHFEPEQKFVPTPSFLSPGEGTPKFAPCLVPLATRRKTFWRGIHSSLPPTLPPQGAKEMVHSLDLSAEGGKYGSVRTR